MAAEANKALVKRFLDNIWQVEDPNAFIDEICAEDLVFSFPDKRLEGRDQFKRHVADARAALHDGQFAVKTMIAEDDSVAIHGTLSVIHEGEFMGIAATGKRITITETAFFRIADGRIAEVCEDLDALGMMKQIGAI